MSFGSGIAIGGPYIEPPPPDEPEITPVVNPSKRPVPIEQVGSELIWFFGGAAALLGAVTTIAFLVESKRG